MSFTTAYQEVGRLLVAAVTKVDAPDSFRELLYIPLCQRGKLLHGEPCPRWPMMVLASSRAAGGPDSVATRVAAAMELFIAAADVLDEIQDGDSSPLATAAGPAQALNAATALLTLAYDQLSSLDEAGLARERIPLFIRTLSRLSFRAAAGQHLDLAAEGADELTVTKALEIARMKAGELGAAACRLGALTGTTNGDLLTHYEAFGRHLGTLAQLSNDLADSLRADEKSDRDRAKGTLPLVYDRGSRDLDPSGALHFTWVVMELERQAALDIVRQLQELGQATASLEALLPDE